MQCNSYCVFSSALCCNTHLRLAFIVWTSQSGWERKTRVKEARRLRKISYLEIICNNKFTCSFISRHAGIFNFCIFISCLFKNSIWCLFFLPKFLHDPTLFSFVIKKNQSRLNNWVQAEKVPGCRIQNWISNFDETVITLPTFGVIFNNKEWKGYN